MEELKVEIGPGAEKLGPDWRTVSAFGGRAVDYLAEWGLDRLPFLDGEVSELYASHVLEHVGWMNAKPALMEAWRVLKPGGLLEIHTIDFEAVLDAYIAGEREHDAEHPMVTLNYRMFAYPVVTGDRACVNWHHSTYDFEYLTWLLGECGFRDFERVAEPRGPEKHGKFNLGVRAWKT